MSLVYLRTRRMAALRGSAHSRRQTWTWSNGTGDLATAPRGLSSPTGLIAACRSVDGPCAARTARLWREFGGSGAPDGLPRQTQVPAEQGSARAARGGGQDRRGAVAAPCSQCRAVISSDSNTETA